MINKKKENQKFWDSQKYKTLSSLEREFLIAYLMYVSKKSPVRPNVKVGISLALSRNLLTKLAEDFAIIWDKKKKRYSIPKKYEQELLSNFMAKQTKSLFNPKTLELYRKLKKETKNAYVFPEIPLCTFIEQSAVSKIIKTKKQLGYFLHSRVDFLITDLDGNPRTIYEFQGTYHNSPKQKEIDSFKRSIINAVGLNVVYIDSKTLLKIN